MSSITNEKYEIAEGSGHMPQEKVWNDSGEDFVLGFKTPLPVGYRSKDDPNISNRICPKCGSNKLSGAVILKPDGKQAVEGANEADPNIFCENCGYWDDSV